MNDPEIDRLYLTVATMEIDSGIAGYIAEQIARHGMSRWRFIIHWLNRRRALEVGFTQPPEFLRLLQPSLSPGKDKTP
jgi:hypothetical protein